MPRHPPNALKSLDHSHYRCPSGIVCLLSAKSKRDGHRSLERLIYINILCLILPVAERSSSTVRGSRTKIQTKPFFTMSMSDQHAFCSRRNSSLGRPGKSRCFHNGVLREVDGGDRRDRTDDLKLAKLPLSQLSYVPGQETVISHQKSGQKSN